jgi:hypothetical protein
VHPHEQSHLQQHADPTKQRRKEAEQDDHWCDNLGRLHERTTKSPRWPGQKKNDHAHCHEKRIWHENGEVKKQQESPGDHDGDAQQEVETLASNAA